MRHSSRMGGRTLEEVLAAVDATVLRPAAGTAGSERAEVSDVVILDWTDPHVLRPGALVLAVGVEPERPAAATLVDRAGEAGAAGVVVRCDRELPPTLEAAADRSGVALLAAPHGAAWGQLYALLRTALASVGEGGATGTAGVAVGDLFSLADAIATALGGPVTIEDPQWRVLAYSNLGHEIDDARRHTILGRTPPPEWQEKLDAAGVRRALRSGEAVVRFESEGLMTRRAVAIRAGGELLGSIWLAAEDEALAPDVDAQLLRAAELSALHLVAHRASEDVERRARGASVRDLLDGHAPAGHREPPLPLSVIAFDARRDDRDRWLTSAERVLSVVSLFAEAAHRSTTCALVDERIWALVPGGVERARLVQVAEQIARRVEDVMGLRLVAAIAPPAERLRDAPAARAAAERALAVLERRPDLGPAVHVDDVHAACVLHELLELAGERPGLRRGPLQELASEQRAAQQLSTLRAYLDAHGDVGRAARELGVHPNTLRYRVRRVVELTGIDLYDPDERLVAELQLRLIAAG
jgi:PucR C-terminal helix-turn-helix domain/Purine catabolism regulatory protein-like family